MLDPKYVKVDMCDVDQIVFAWQGSITPKQYREICETFPESVDMEIRAQCEIRGFPNAFEDQEWEYMRAAGELARDLANQLLSQRRDAS